MDHTPVKTLRRRLTGLSTNCRSRKFRLLTLSLTLLTPTICISDLGIGTKLSDVLALHLRGIALIIGVS